MSYDSHSKHVILIGIIHIIGCILSSLEPITTGIMMMTSNVRNADSYNDFTIINLVLVGFYILMAIFAALMIRGVVKQRHALIAPWLILSGLSLIATIAVFMMHVFYEFSEILHNMDYYIYTIGMQILVLYPTYTLYMKLCPKSSNQDLYNELGTKNHVLAQKLTV